MVAKKVVKKGKNVLIISASKQAFELGKKMRPVACVRRVPRA